VPASLTSGYAVPADDVAPARLGAPYGARHLQPYNLRAKSLNPCACTPRVHIQQIFRTLRVIAHLSLELPRLRRIGLFPSPRGRSSKTDSITGGRGRRGGAGRGGGRAATRRALSLLLARTFPRFGAIPICDLPRAIKRITVAPERSRISGDLRSRFAIRPRGSTADSVKGARGGARGYARSRRGNFAVAMATRLRGANEGRSSGEDATGCDLPLREPRQVPA
jgi:hypothetical protein